MPIFARPKLRSRRRQAKLVWKNYAVLMGYTITFRGDMLQLMHKAGGEHGHDLISCYMHILMHPSRLVENPTRAGWCRLAKYEDIA